MKALFDVPAPAKLNLFLHVTGRREDGYHLLQSAFMLIDWCDTLHFERRSDGHVHRHDLGTTLPDDDLITRAAALLKKTANTPLGADISIDKRIPAQAGMGGGSSDAASTLLALNRLWQLDWPLNRLEQLGLQLGADVPFFLRGHNAWIEGVGEQITPLELPSARFCIIKPRAGLETASIFRHPQLERSTKPATIAVFAADPYGFGHNDLQPVAELLCPEVTSALELFRAHGLQARMTGSGSAVFAHCAQGSVAIHTPDHWIVRECGNLEVHPLQGWASSDN
ncbi:MAG: 4-(cytidine 5'-diphospho)-2-C-methyl-D-erythritol kinase [Limnohabitans sp.]